jgi:TRAP-type C4-dicarboxylate transport system permease small subunit
MSAVLNALARVDRGWARVERGLALGVLLVMLLVAALTALLQLLTRLDVAWAVALGGELDWSDTLLRSGTLWLAFLGMSLAAHRQRHVGVDRMLRTAPQHARDQMRAASSLVTSAITVGLLIAFSRAVHSNLGERPALYELLSPSGALHVCDATSEQLAQYPDAAPPALFCALRSLLAACSLPAETPGAAAQLIIPLMLLVVALRFFADGARHAWRVLRGDDGVAGSAGSEP